MERDSVRTGGDSTFVDMWIDGKMRSIAVTNSAIEAFVQRPLDRGDMSEDERSNFVRTHLSLVLGAATAKLHSTDPAADEITIECGEFAGQPVARGTERRRGDRRRGDRRQRNLGAPVSGDRRRR